MRKLTILSNLDWAMPSNGRLFRRSIEVYLEHDERFGWILRDYYVCEDNWPEPLILTHSEDRESLTNQMSEETQVEEAYQQFLLSYSPEDKQELPDWLKDPF